MGHYDGFDKDWLKMMAEAKRAGLSIGEVKQFIEDHKRKAISFSHLQVTSPKMD